MFRRRRRGEEGGSTPAEGAAAQADRPDGGGSDPAGPDEDSASPVKPDRPNGPWDVDELDPDRPDHAAPRLDLGALRIRPHAGMRVQLQVDKATGKAGSVLLVGDQAAVQLMAIAAAKSRPQWPQTKAALYADAMRRGGSAQEGTGPWGPVLRMALPAEAPDGTKGVQPSVVLGVDGPRWLLRATFIGKAAVEQDRMNQMMRIVQDTVVVRGDEPMPPGEVIGLTPPARPETAVDVEAPPDAPG